MSITNLTAKEWIKNNPNLPYGVLIEDLKTIYSLNNTEAQSLIDSVREDPHNSH